MRALQGKGSLSPFLRFRNVAALGGLLRGLQLLEGFDGSDVKVIRLGDSATV